MSGTYGSNGGTHGNESIRPDSGNPFQQRVHDGNLIAGWKNVCPTLCGLAVKSNQINRDEKEQM